MSDGIFISDLYFFARPTPPEFAVQMSRGCISVLISAKNSPMPPSDLAGKCKETFTKNTYGRDMTQALQKNPKTF